MSADLTSVGERIRSVAVDIAWQMWSALGVSSWESRTPRSVIELEPLIALTAVGAWDDRRLVSQAVDWCVANADLVSLHQMRRVVEDNAWPFEGPIAEFGATAGHFMRKPWPGVRSEQPFLRDLPLKSKPPDLRDPALIALRLRAVFGVGARSEILRFLLFHPWPNTAAQIAREIPYGERQITKDLRLLTLADITRSSMHGSSAEYVLSDASALESITGKPSAQPMPWGPVFRLTTEMADAFIDLGTHDFRNPDTALAARFRRLSAVLERLTREHWWTSPAKQTVDDVAEWIPWFLDQIRQHA